MKRNIFLLILLVVLVGLVSCTAKDFSPLDQDKPEAVNTKTLSWYLLNGEWKLDSISIHDLRSGVLSKYKMWGVSGNLQLKLIFNSNGKVFIIQNEFKGDDKWFLDESVTPPTLFIGQKGQEHLPGSLFYKIDKLDANNLIVYRDSVEYVEDPTHKANNREFYSH